MDREQALNDVADWYRSLGYQVVVRPWPVPQRAMGTSAMHSGDFETVPLLPMMRQPEPRPSGRWQQLRAWLGLSVGEETALGGLGRRLAFAAVGAVVVLAVGSVAPAWVGLSILAVWFLPLLCHAGLGLCVVVVGVPIVGLAGVRALPTFCRLVASQAVEECVLVVTVALLAGWLL